MIGYEPNTWYPEIEEQASQLTGYPTLTRVGDKTIDQLRNNSNYICGYLFELGSVERTLFIASTR